MVDTQNELNDDYHTVGASNMQGQEWQRLRTEDNKLHPAPLLRHCHRVGNHVVKKILQPDEPDFYGRLTTQQHFLRLHDENSMLATELVTKHTTIPTPKVADKDKDFVVHPRHR